MDHGEFEHGQETGGELFVAGGDAAGLFEPTDGALNNVATTIGIGVEHQRPAWFAAMRFVFFGNDWSDAAAAKPRADPRHVVTFVAS